MAAPGLESAERLILVGPEGHTRGRHREEITREKMAVGLSVVLHLCQYRLWAERGVLGYFLLRFIFIKVCHLSVDMCMRMQAPLEAGGIRSP